MVWFRIDDDFYDHPKTEDLPDSAVALWTRAGAYCARHLTDGLIPARKARRLCDNPDEAIAALVAAGLWEEEGDAYRFILNGRFCSWARSDERATISPALRRAVYDRDGWRCLVCLSPDDLTLDHMWPWSLGGRDTYDNLQTLCRSCNSRKGARVNDVVQGR